MYFEKHLKVRCTISFDLAISAVQYDCICFLKISAIMLLVLDLFFLHELLLTRFTSSLYKRIAFYSQCQDFIFIYFDCSIFLAKYFSLAE